MKKLNELQSYLTRLRGLMLTLIILCSIGSGNAWGESITLTKTSLGIPQNYATSTTSTTVSDVDFSYDKLSHQGQNRIQSQASNGAIWNTSLIPGKITNVTINKESGNNRSSTLYWGTSAKSTTEGSSSVSGTSSTNSPANSCFGYFYIKRGANATYWSSVVVTYTPATITLSKSSISGLDYAVGGGPSAAQTFTVSGSNIPANLTVTAPTNFEVSLDGSSWASSKTINVTLTGSASAGTLSSTTVYVRLASGKSAGNYSGDVSIAMAGCKTISSVNPKTVAVSGTVSAASCTTNPTVTAASNSSVTATTATVSCSSGISSLGSAGCSITDYGFVIGTSSNPTIGGSGVTKHQVGTTYTVAGTSFSKDLTGLSAETTYYVRPYATNGNGTAYGTQTSFTTSALPKYTVTLKDDNSTLTQVSYGATVTLPTRTGCTGYTFAGWTKSWAAAQTEWTTTAPTIIPAGSYTPSANENLYPVYTKTESGGGSTTKTYGWETADDATNWTISGIEKYDTYKKTGSYSGKIARGSAGESTIAFKDKVKVTSFSFQFLRQTTNNNYNVRIETSSDGSSWDDVESYNMSVFSTKETWYAKSHSFDGKTALYVRFVCYTSTAVRWVDDISITYAGGSTTYYISVPGCCTDPELAYGTGSVTKTFGDAVFTNTLTNSHGVAVTYSSSDETVATVNGSGQVTILKAGSTTITASSAAQTVAAVSYCADEASYTLTVNKASISPTLTYSPNSVAAGSNTSAPTVGGNTGGGGVTYAITSATPSGCATINTSTGVVTGAAVGSVTVTATVAATTNYNGGTATANVTITAASGYCISAFNSSNNGITSGFSNGGSGNEYTLNYTIPGKDGSSNWPQYWIGENEAWASFSANALFADMHFTHSDATLGLAEGATGKLHIWDDNKASGSNLWVKFEPDGYGFRWGGAGEWDQAANTKAFTVDAGDANVYWTDIVTLDGTNNTTWNYYVGLQTASGYVYSGVDNEASDSRGISRTRSVTAMKVSNGTAGSWKGTYLSSEPTGSRGKFRIWNNNIDDYNFYCHWVPFYRVTYDGSGASGSTAASADVCCEGNAAARTVVAAANGFTVPTGKTFGGWASSPENAAAKIVAYAANADVILTGSITLYAIWNDIDYTVTVNQSPSVGATTTGQTTTAHYNGTINLTTTVPSGYRFVNWTTSDGFSITNSTSATTASFTMPNKSVTVTANFQQTHKVDWYVGGSAPANKIGDDGQTTVVDHGGKIEDFPATTPDGSACDKEFVGWTNTSSYVHGTSPLFNDVAGSPTINADAQFYAVFAAGGATEDEITVDETGATAESGTYSSWSDVSISSNAVYAGNTAGGSSGNASVQMRSNNSNSGIVTTASGGKVTKVVVDWNSSSANGRTLDIYGKNTAYTAATDLYDNSKQGTKLGSIVNGTSTELAISGDYSYIGLRSNSGAMYLNSITISWSSATGHTINCTSCANSVTVNYSDPGSGNTMAVTKGSTPIASGTSVKTCSAQSLTVTLTPATHYTVTNFEATGVAGVTTTNVGNVYTVSIPADKTGTLTLNPTFTPETPLTITLNTNNKGTFDPIGDVYSGESFTFPVVTPSDAECASFLGWIEGTTFDGAGETTDPSDVTSLPEYHAASTSSGTLTTNKTYTAVFGEKDTKETTAYVKVTSAPADWSGDYLIVRESIERAFNGSLETLDAANNYIDITIVDGKIAKGSLAANQFTIAKVGATDNYTIKSASGKYIGRTATSNGLDASTSTEYTNTLAYSSDHVVITSSGGPTLQMNGGTRFRYYASSQQELQLYKLGTAQMITYTYTTNPACTPRYRVTVNSAVGGSPSADKTYEHADEAITLTAHPAAGYSFTGWTITHTEGGAAASVTYTTGSASTETAVFEMPAYDVTVTASYAKIPVASLQVKDGETVIANSGTVNISTGANKTLTVVVTPADAFDHSWSASVTGGGTYASITNVQAGTFQVNGLAQGDATVTVTAPNDGDAKTVTFTVHVTDILPTEVVLKRDGSNTSISELSIYEGQYVKVNVSFTPTPTNKDFSVSADGTFVTIHAQAHTNPNYYATLNGKKVTTSPVNVTFTSAATSSVTKNLAVTVLPCPADQFVDYIHGNATVTRAAQVSADHWSINTSITTPTLSDEPESASADCEAGHYHLIGWLPQSIAEALFEAGTPITSETEGLVTAGAEIEASGITWYAIWAKKE